MWLLSFFFLKVDSFICRQTTSCRQKTGNNLYSEKPQSWWSTLCVIHWWWQKKQNTSLKEIHNVKNVCKRRVWLVVLLKIIEIPSLQKLLWTTGKINKSPNSELDLSTFILLNCSVFRHPLTSFFSPHTVHAKPRQWHLAPPLPPAIDPPYSEKKTRQKMKKKTNT